MRTLSKENVLMAHSRPGLRSQAMRLGYARVSTDEQASALEAQITRLTAAGCDVVLSDRESGRSNERPGMIEAMVLVRSGEATELVVTRVDRLSRDATYGDMLLALCEAHRVTVRALDGGVIETATPQGFLLARLQTSLAEMESRMLSMRIKRQFEVYRTQGRHLRRRKPFGYRGGADHKLEPHPDQWGHALRVIEELRRHRSFSRTADAMVAWCPWTPSGGNLQGWFTNPVIRGHIAHLGSGGKGWKRTWGAIHYDQHPALICEADWRELADVLRRTYNKFADGPTVDARHGLTGLLRCASCGHRMRRNTAQGIAWWRCRHRLCGDRGGAREEAILPVVIDECVAAAEALAAALAGPAEDDPMVTVKLADLEQLQELARRNPGNAGLMAAVRETEAEIRSLRRRERPAVDLEAYEALRDPAFFVGATAEEQRAIFSGVLLEVRIGAGGVPILPIRRM